MDRRSEEDRGRSLDLIEVLKEIIDNADEYELLSYEVLEKVREKSRNSILMAAPATPRSSKTFFADFHQDFLVKQFMF